MGYECSAVIGRTLRELDSWTDPAPSQRWLQWLRKQKTLHNVETNLRAHGGDIHSVLGSLELIQMGSEDYVLAIFDDVTERKQAEQALRESENLRRTMIESEPECVKLIAPDGTLLDINPAGLAMIEADYPNQVIGQSALHLIASEWRAIFAELNHKICRGESVVAEFEIVGLKGTRRWMKTHAVPLRGKDSQTRRRVTADRLRWNAVSH